MDSEGLFPIVRRWWKVLLVGAVLAGVIAFVFGSQMTKQYEAEVRLLAGPVSADESVLGAAGTLTRSYAEIAVNRPTLEAAAERSGVEATDKELRERTTVSANEVSRFITVRFKDEDPQRAARFLNRLSRILVGLGQSETAVQEALIDDIVSQPELEGFSERGIARVRAAAEAVLTRNAAGKLSIVDPAKVPEESVSPNVPLVTLLGMIVGVIAVGLAAFLYEVSRAPSRPTSRVRRGEDGANGFVDHEQIAEEYPTFERIVGAAYDRRPRANGGGARPGDDVPAWITDPTRRRSEARARRS